MIGGGMIGKRRDLIRRQDGNYDCLAPGEYGKDEDGLWYCCAPTPVDADGFDFYGALGDGSGVRGHNVVEHEDGTITVSPSILITRHDGRWHGYLERGVWREC